MLFYAGEMPLESLILKFFSICAPSEDLGSFSFRIFDSIHAVKSKMRKSWFSYLSLYSSWISGDSFSQKASRSLRRIGRFLLFRNHRIIRSVLNVCSFGEERLRVMERDSCRISSYSCVS